MSIESSINLMERMGLLPPERKLRKNIFEYYETFNEILEEGIFKSHPAEDIFRILKKHFNVERIESNAYRPAENEIGIQFDTYRDSVSTYGSSEVSVISLVVPENHPQIEDIKRFFKLCGWVLSESTNFPGSENFIIYTFEKRRQEDELPVPKFLYHLTPENKLNKILINGLVPKAQNKLSEHPERIYFFLTRDLTLNYKLYADSFWESTHENTPRNINYILLKIDTKKCRDGFKIYGDPNMIRGVWTFDNVPPEAITIEEEGI